MVLEISKWVQVQVELLSWRTQDGFYLSYADLTEEGAKDSHKVSYLLTQYILGRSGYFFSSIQSLFSTMHALSKPVKSFTFSKGSLYLFFY